VKIKPGPLLWLLHRHLGLCPYMSRRGDPNYNPAADFNHEGVINQFDARVLLQHTQPLTPKLPLTAREIVNIRGRTCGTFRVQCATGFLERPARTTPVPIDLSISDLPNEICRPNAAPGELNCGTQWHFLSVFPAFVHWCTRTP
jgi:hypothetical protein